ncbi:3-dehydroquinate synthase [Paenibacillus vortex V453]|uniref:3-dehydroquinate synthase n=1 Tax=Paenibacillus vortex V453 TaxID=715225 RepID=A0A2R9SX00_9BACL|nr:hypothetical protein [Paenibacillus vortex]EFU41939.1 3-dehydroquinate synthase [Paenibacillus vortex V453]
MTESLNYAKRLMSQMKEVQPTFRGLDDMALERGVILDVPLYLIRRGSSRHRSW